MQYFSSALKVAVTYKESARSEKITHAVLLLVTSEIFTIAYLTFAEKKQDNIQQIEKCKSDAQLSLKMCTFKPSDTFVTVPFAKADILYILFDNHLPIYFHKHYEDLILYQYEVFWFLIIH